NRALEVVGIAGRYIDDRTPKARTLGTLRDGAFLTPGAFSSAQISVCEGPIDALSLMACHIPAIALCGTSWPRWLSVVCGLREVAVCLDADEAGDKACE